MKRSPAGIPDCILIDGRRELAAISPNGLIGDRVIQDTHHPTLAGYVALAGAVLRELQARHTFLDAQPIALPLDPGECAGHFGMDADKVGDRVRSNERPLPARGRISI